MGISRAWLLVLCISYLLCYCYGQDGNSTTTNGATSSGNATSPFNSTTSSGSGQNYTYNSSSTTGPSSGGTNTTQDWSIAIYCDSTTVAILQNFTCHVAIYTTTMILDSEVVYPDFLTCSGCDGAGKSYYSPSFIANSTGDFSISAYFFDESRVMKPANSVVIHVNETKTPMEASVSLSCPMNVKLGQGFSCVAIINSAEIYAEKIVAPSGLPCTGCEQHGLSYFTANFTANQAGNFSLTAYFYAAGFAQIFSNTMSVTVRALSNSVVLNCGTSVVVGHPFNCTATTNASSTGYSYMIFSSPIYCLSGCSSVYYYPVYYTNAFYPQSYSSNFLIASSGTYALRAYFDDGTGVLTYSNNVTIRAIGSLQAEYINISCPSSVEVKQGFSCAVTVNGYGYNQVILQYTWGLQCIGGCSGSTPFFVATAAGSYNVFAYFVDYKNVAINSSVVTVHVNPMPEVENIELDCPETAEVGEDITCYVNITTTATNFRSIINGAGNSLVCYYCEPFYQSSYSASFRVLESGNFSLQVYFWDYNSSYVTYSLNSSIFVPVPSTPAPTVHANPPEGTSSESSEYSAATTGLGGQNPQPNNHVIVVALGCLAAILFVVLLMAVALIIRLQNTITEVKERGEGPEGGAKKAKGVKKIEKAKEVKVVVPATTKSTGGSGGEGGGRGVKNTTTATTNAATTNNNTKSIPAVVDSKGKERVQTTGFERLEEEEDIDDIVVEQVPVEDIEEEEEVEEVEVEEEEIREGGSYYTVNQTLAHPSAPPESEKHDKVYNRIIIA